MTAFSSNLWCERQAHLKRVTRRDVRTAAMAAGNAIHEALEAEVHEVVPIVVETPADRVAVRLLNAIQCIGELLAGASVTRETPVWAPLALPATEALRSGKGGDQILDSGAASPPVPPKAAVLFGIVDELALVRGADGANARTLVRDSKTRASGSLPSARRVRRIRCACSASPASIRSASSKGV